MLKRFCWRPSTCKFTEDVHVNCFHCFYIYQPIPYPYIPHIPMADWIYTYIFIPIKFIQIFYRFSIKFRRKDSEQLWKLFASDKRRIWFVLPGISCAGTCCFLARFALRPFFGFCCRLLSVVVGCDAVGDLLQRLVGERHELGDFGARDRRSRFVLLLGDHCACKVRLLHTQRAATTAVCCSMCDRNNSNWWCLWVISRMMRRYDG